MRLFGYKTEWDSKLTNLTVSSFVVQRDLLANHETCLKLRGNDRRRRRRRNPLVHGVTLTAAAATKKRRRLRRRRAGVKRRWFRFR